MCSVKVVLSGLPSVVIERRHAALHAAIDVALRATEQAVRRSVRRRRMKPRRGRNATKSIHHGEHRSRRNGIAGQRRLNRLAFGSTTPHLIAAALFRSSTTSEGAPFPFEGDVSF